MKPNTEPSITTQDFPRSSMPSTQQASNILASSICSADIPRDQLALIGTACTKPYALIVISNLAYRSKSEALETLEFLKGSPVSNVAAYANSQIIVLVAYDDARQLIDALANAGRTSCKSTNVLSLPFENVCAINQQYELALYCLSRAGTNRVVDAKDWALSFMKKRMTESFNFDGLMHPALAKLAHYDEANQSNLLQTLKVYLEYDRNAQRCANVLYLHRNSLQYRVRRIQEIAGINLENPAERAYLRLSFFFSE